MRIQYDQVIKNPLIIALDVDLKEKALQLATDLSPYAGAFKLGPRLIHRYGEEIVKKIASYAPVFVDCKFFDIPSTMESSVQAAFDSGASLVTIHALSGAEAMKKISILEQKLNQLRPFKVLCVTILTSWDQQSLPPIIKEEEISRHVVSLADLARKSGLSGLVCSAEELDLLKDKGHFIVVPGIRIDSLGDDQKRIMPPELAMKKGASALVVGRPIITAANPKLAAEEFLKRINHS